MKTAGKITEAPFIYSVLVLIAGIVLPAILIPLVKITGHSEIVEEIAKAVVILFIVAKLNIPNKIIIGAILFGVLFGLSENIFYLSNVFEFGSLPILQQRFILTTAMHALTATVLALSVAYKKWLFLVGVVLSIAIHLIFNSIAF